MKIKVKKIYKEAVKQLEKHQVEISTALQVIAIAASARTIEAVSDEEQEAAEEIQNVFLELLEYVNDIISQINQIIEEDENAID